VGTDTANIWDDTLYELGEYGAQGFGEKLYKEVCPGRDAGAEAAQLLGASLQVAWRLCSWFAADMEF
jgi:hypothetical protein